MFRSHVSGWSINILGITNQHVHVMLFLAQGGGRPGAGGSGGAGGMFGFGQTTAKIMKDDVGVRFR